MYGMFENCTSFNQSLCSWTKIVNKNVLNRDTYLANQIKICSNSTSPGPLKSNFSRNSLDMYY